jgi:hypothetical protein
LNVLVQQVCEVQTDKMEGRQCTAEDSQTLRVSAWSRLYLEKLIISQPAQKILRFLGTTDFIFVSTVEGTPLSDILLPGDIF